MKINKDTRDTLLKLAKEKKIFLEGNILKIIDPDKDDAQLIKYVAECKERDTASRRKRLDVTKRVQAQNKELELADKENNRVNKQLTKALSEAEKSMNEANEAKAEAEKLRDAAMEDLDTIQKKAQFELIGTIVRVALWVIIGVGVLTTIMYGVALISDTDTQIIGSTWSNMFGILLTNAFSIVGTIMGVKYATENNKA